MMRPAHCCSDPNHDHGGSARATSTPPLVAPEDEVTDEMESASLDEEELGREDYHFDINVEVELPPLWLAAQMGDVEEVKRLLGEKIDVNCKNEADGSTPLIVAMLENSPNHQLITQALLAAPDIDVDASTSNSIFPLAIACADNNETAVQTLLAHGARLSRRTMGGTPLIALAAAHCSRSCIELMVNSGADVHSKSDGGTTALIACCKRSDLGPALEVGQYLLRFGMVDDRDNLGATALVYALKHRNLALAEELLHQGNANASIATFDGITPLMCACMIPSLDMARSLWSAGATLTAVTEEGLTALHYAANESEPELIDFLGSTSPLLVNRSSYDGKTPLLVACENNDLASAQVLLRLEAGANPAPIRQNRDPEDEMGDGDSEDLTGEAPIVAASRFGNLPLVELLVIHGADVNVVSSTDGTTALICAVALQSERLVRYLLGAGASPNIPSPEYAYPIYIAAQLNNQPIAELLCQSGAALDVQPLAGESFSALGEAARLGFANIVRTLLVSGASPTIVTNEAVTPLHAASFEGCDEVVTELLLVAGADSFVDAKDIDGATPLMLAAQENKLGVIKLLLSVNANLNEQDHTGSTPLMAAVGSGHIDAVRLLLQHSPDLTLRNVRGCTALWIAAALGKEEAVRMLVESGSDPSLRSEDGLSPLDIAAKLGHESVVSYLTTSPHRVAAVAATSAAAIAVLPPGTPDELMDTSSATASTD